MAQRRWQVRPDQAIETSEGTLGVVSQDALIKAVYDAAIMLDRAGGVASVVVGRTPTGLQGEMVTTGAVVEWKDRTDARAQPEKPVAVHTEPAPLALVEAEERPEVDESELPPELRKHG